MEKCNIANKYCERERFFSQEKEPLDLGITENKLFKFYKLKETGQLISEFTLKSNLGGEIIEIAQITDIHLNYCLPEDLENEELKHTHKCRTWLAGGESVTSITKAMDVACLFDQTVITGDILDYLSCGAMMLTKKLIFERDPKIICTPGGHDATREMETGVKDKLSPKERLKILEKEWIHDIYYFSRILKNKVTVVAMYNGMGMYYPKQIEFLKQDIQKAREENRIILIFQHEPISTGNPKDYEVQPIWPVNRENIKTRNFYNSPIGNPDTKNKFTKEMYQLITESADVIKGVFCGHYHSAFYTEIKAMYAGGKYKSYIPQIVAMGNPYFGHVGIVTRIVIE